MGRNFLVGTAGDANNAVLAAVGYNFSLILNWLRWLLWALVLAALATAGPPLSVGLARRSHASSRTTNPGTQTDLARSAVTALVTSLRKRLTKQPPSP